MPEEIKETSEIKENKEEPKDQIEQDQDEEEQEEQEEQEENEGIHPADALEDVMGEVITQCNRLRSRGMIDAKKEMLDNIYPLMSKICESFIQYTEMVDNEIFPDEDENNNEENTRKALIESTKKTIEVCDKIEKIKNEIVSSNDKDLVEKLGSELKDLEEWVKNIKDQSKDILENQENNNNNQENDNA